jgi:hypothetical protein
MKKIIISILIATIAFDSAIGQVNMSGHFYGEDALHFSQYSNYGTARTAGMGGSFTALGGDASSAFVNPAGLGFYNRSEFSISPVFRNIATTASYLGNTLSRNSSKVGLAHASAVISKQGKGANQKRSAFAVTYHTLVNFQNEFAYSGSNNRSSIMDYFAEQATLSGATTADLDNEFDTNTGYADTQESMYYQAYTINPFQGGYVVAENSFPVDQQGTVTETGNLGQLNLAYGSNFDDKVYLGASVGLQTLTYNMVTNHQERFPNGEIFNGVGSTDDLIVNGNGVNLTIGAIYKASRKLSLGINITTPTAMRVRETIFSSVQIDQIPGTFETDFNTIQTLPGDFNYRITSPLRGNVGVSYLLPKKVGVLSLEAEYVGYGSMSLKDKDNAIWSAEQQNAIAASFNNVVNIKGGVELRKSNFRVRGGVNYLADPVANSNGVDRSKLIVSAGLGYRNSKIFIDAAYTANTSEGSFSPYTLSNPENFDSSLISNKSGVLSLSVGTFF